MASAPRLTAERIAALGTPRKVPSGTILIHEGERSDDIYVVNAGRLNVFLADEAGRELILNELGPGRWFGELSLDGMPRSASVMAVEDSRVTKVRAADFKAFLASDPEAAFELLVSVIRLARNVTRAAGHLALMDVYGRFARWLLDHAQEIDGVLTVPGRHTDQGIADRIGATREMVNRVKNGMQESGLVAFRRDRIEIRDGVELLLPRARMRGNGQAAGRGAPAGPQKK